MLNSLLIILPVVVLNGLLIILPVVVLNGLQLLVLNSLLIILPMFKALWPYTAFPTVLNSLKYYNALTKKVGSSRRS